MALSIFASELVEEQTCFEDDNGLVATRVFGVTGITSITGALIQARTATGVPVYGETHPDAPDIVCRRITPKPWAGKSRTDAKVICEYRAPDFGAAVSPVIRINGLTRDVPTNFAYDGKPIKPEYFPAGGGTLSGIATVIAPQAFIVLEYELLLPQKPSVLTYLNKINSSQFQIGGKWMWWCSELDIEKELYRGQFHCHFVFQFNEKTWIKPAVYTDPITGYPPDDIEPNPDYTITGTVGGRGGWRNVPVNGEANFNALNLPLAF
jgi:hypothetical protein